MLADPQVVSALQGKAHDLRPAITTYEKLERTRHAPAAVTVT